MTVSPIDGCRILVVEDEMLVAMLIEDMLRDFGCEVIGPVATVEQALGMIRTAGTINAAVLDVNLNGDKSFPVADELAEQNVPFLFATGYEKKSIPDKYRSIPLLQKPMSERDLHDTITSVTSRGVTSRFDGSK